MLGWPSTGRPLTGEYEARSPTLGRRVLYDDREIEAECGRLIARFADKPRLQVLAETVPLFANPDRLVTAQASEWARVYRLARATNVPLARSLDELPAHLADAFLTIDQQMDLARAFKAANRR